jgi:hypothetical protein
MNNNSLETRRPRRVSNDSLQHRTILSVKCADTSHPEETDLCPSCLPWHRIRISIEPIQAMMFRTSRLCAFSPLLGRLLAGGCAALVVLLAVLAASPALHEWLHHDAGAADHECAVTLFQHGADAAVAAIALAATAWTVIALVVATPTGPDLDRSHYWLPPGNAPPALN